MLPRSLNYLSFPLRPKKKETAKTQSPRPTSSTNKNPTKRRSSQPAIQPASHHLNMLLKETHTERKEANAYFDQQVSSTKRNTTQRAARTQQPSLPVGAVTLWTRGKKRKKEKKKRIGGARLESQMAKCMLSDKRGNEVWSCWRGAGRSVVRLGGEISLC